MLLLKLVRVGTFLQVSGSEIGFLIPLTANFISFVLPGYPFRALVRCQGTPA